MKWHFIQKLFFIVLVCSTLMYCQGSTKKFETQNNQQLEFNTFLKENEKEVLSLKNEILKKEFVKTFESRLGNYLDSEKVFVNWEGNIKNIKIKEFNDVEFIKFDIVFKLKFKGYQEVTFNCSYKLDNDNLQNDVIYNEMKNMTNNSLVYFDGFIKRTIDKSVVYAGMLNDSYAKSLINTYSHSLTSTPQYKFNIIKLSSKSMSPTLSESLSNAIKIDFEIIELFRKEYLKQISKEERIIEYNKLNFDLIQSNLTDTEKQYSQKVRQYLFEDYFKE